MKKVIIIFAVIGLASCSKGKPDAIQGKTEQEHISISGKIAGRVSDVFVKQGDFVNKGDTLAVLEIPEVEAKQMQVSGALESATAQYEMALRGATANQLTQLNAKKSALKEQFEFAQKSVNRLENMLQDSLIPQQTFDEASAKMEGARAQLKAVEAEIADVKNGARPEQQNMALGQKNQALGAMQEVATAQGERYIIAPVDMTIETVTLKPGELALPGYTLFNGSLPQTTYFRFTLPESRLGEIKKGQEVNVHVVYADMDIKGTIQVVSQLAAYANIATAYPDYEMQESLYEIHVMPIDKEAAKEIFTKTTVVLNL